MGQLAQICSEHSDGQATLRDTLGSQREEHSSVREASLQDMDAMLQAEVAMMSDQQSDHKSAQLLSLKAFYANIKFHLDQMLKDHIGGTQRCTTSWAVRRPNTVTPPKLHFKIWIPSCSWKLSGYQYIPIIKALSCLP